MSSVVVLAWQSAHLVLCAPLTSMVPTDCSCLVAWVAFIAVGGSAVLVLMLGQKSAEPVAATDSQTDLPVPSREVRDLLVGSLAGLRTAPFRRSQQCSICLESRSKGAVFVQPAACKHPCHLRCLGEWIYTQASRQMEPSCPTCRASLVD